MDIVASSIISTYGVDKQYYPKGTLISHSILSFFSRNRHDIMGNISERNWRQRTHSAFFVAVFSPIPYLKYQPNII